MTRALLTAATRRTAVVLLMTLGLELHAATAAAQTAITPPSSSPTTYRLTFPDRAHRLMDVAATFVDVPPGPLRLHMSRSSPGRYALHQFAKNVFDVRVTDGAGQ